MIFSRKSNIEEILKYCTDKGFPITKEDFKPFSDRDLQIARRSACLHLTKPRLIGHIMVRKYRERMRTAFDGKSAAAGDR